MLRIHRTRLNQSKLSRLSWLGLAGTVSCCALVSVFGLMLFPSLPQVTYAAIPEVTPSTGTSVGINLPASIDFDSVTPTPDGATTTATANLTVTTTNSASYSLYLYSSDGDNSLRPKISANTSSIIATAGGVGLTLSSLEPNTWGYNLGTEAPTDSTTYSAVPTDNTTPIQTKNTSSTNSANDTYTLSFGAKVDTSIPSGAYSDTLTIAVVAEPAMVTVAFNGNGATSGSMSSIKVPAGGSQTLPSNTFTRDGYMFNGWNTASNGSGTSYADGANYTAPAESAGQTITLYAQWAGNLLDDVTYMQDLTPEHCSGSYIGATATLIDRRDNNSYTIKKIPGWNGSRSYCLMTQNLRIAGGTVLTPTDSNVTTNYVIPTADLTLGDTLTEGRIHNSGNTTQGYWYNACAASAGTACVYPYYFDGEDICPIGWTLNPGHPFWDSEEISEFSPVTGGYWSGGAYINDNTGYYWTTSNYNWETSYVRTFSLSGSGWRTGNNILPRANGYNVRCGMYASD